jgi:SnoaL-like domain
MPDDAGAAEKPAALAGRVRSALKSGDLDAVRDLLDPGARWGAPEGPGDADCHHRDQVIAWWASARAAGARAVVTEVTADPGTLLVGLEVTGTPAAREEGGTAWRWQVLAVSGGRIADIRGFGDRTEAAARAGVPALAQPGYTRGRSAREAVEIQAVEGAPSARTARTVSYSCGVIRTTPV